MFDEFFTVSQRPKSDARVYIEKTVTEHRAPTDESIRLYKELSEKAAESVIETQHIKDTAFEAVLVAQKDFMTMTTKYICKYKLNGKEFITRLEIPEWQNKARNEVMTELRDKIASQIATEILLSTIQ